MPDLDRTFMEFCRGACGGGMRSGSVDFRTAHFDVSIPSRCPNKDACEADLLDRLEIKPVRDAAGAIVRT